MTLAESLEALATQNHYGVAFLLAYGATWITCGILWRVLGHRNAALATLFQGMVAFPIALGLSYAIGALGQDRQVDQTITQLSMYIGTSQLLGLPFLIYLFARQQFTLMPYAFAAICAMHFMLYSWLYQTPLYVIMAAVIAFGGLLIMLIAQSRQKSSSVTASLVCFFVGLTMLATTVAFQFI